MDFLLTCFGGGSPDVASILEKYGRLQSEVKRDSFVSQNGRIQIAYQKSTRFEIGMTAPLGQHGFILREGYSLEATDKAVLTACQAEDIDKIVSKIQEIIESAFGEFCYVIVVGSRVIIFQSIGGTRPLFYRVVDGAVLASNRSSPLADVAFGRCDLDYMGMSEVIAFDSLISDCTAFKSISKLSTGAVIVIDFSFTTPRHHIYEAQNIFADGSSPREFSELMTECEDVVGHVVADLKQYSQEADFNALSTYNLSGGKDSRVLALILREAGILQKYKSFMTVGLEEYGEVKAARLFAQQAKIPLKVVPPAGDGGDNFTGFNKKLGDHLFQMEGEISPRILHGNLALQQMNITGHEAGLREAFPVNKALNSWPAVRKYITSEFRNINVDPIRMLRTLPTIDIMNKFFNKIESAIRYGVRPENFLQWQAIVNRGSRWVGRLTGQSAAHGFYINPLLHPRIVKFVHNAGLRARHAEIFHSTVLYTLGRDYLNIPFSGQSLSVEFQKFLQQRNISFADQIPLGLTYNETLWWNKLYALDDNKYIRSLLYCSRTEPLDELIDFNALDNYVDTHKVPSARPILGIFSVIGTGIISRHGGVDSNISNTALSVVREAIEQAKLPNIRMSSPKSFIKFIGRIDIKEKGRVAGWIKETSKGSPLSVEVVYNGNILAEGKQNIRRNDVARVHGGSELCGFDLEFPPVDQPGNIKIRVKGHAFTLS